VIGHYNIACEICHERIEEGDDAVKIETGETRSKWWRSILGYFRTNPSRDYGLAVAHIECIDCEHDANRPEKTCYNLIKRLGE
jgi:hypothetical protein